MLDALRSHDDRFEAMVNHIDLDQRPDDRLDVIPVTVDSSSTTVVVPPDGAGGRPCWTCEFGAAGVADASLRQDRAEGGDREYWENWSQPCGGGAASAAERITALVRRRTQPRGRGAVRHVRDSAAANLNDGISTTTRSPCCPST
ncbi:hypothetical protein QJS66_10405 [Kocuria rhizophila]|nr:hypothetical protein QJS66_10405 [Kocuria rhizophila]